MQHPSHPSVLLTAILVTTALHAQHDDVNKMAEMLAREETSLTVGRVRYDLVGMDHPNIEDPTTIFLRVARRTAEGWSVHVYTGECGHLVMAGTFSDEALTVAEGTFTFHHPNGEVESTGLFRNGVKSGVWKRFDPQGKALADRVYDPTALPPDHMLECWSTLSCKP